MDAIETLREHAIALLASGDERGLQVLLADLRPSDFADLAVAFDQDEIARLIEAIPEEWRHDYVAELHPEEAADYIESLTHDEAADLLEEMDPDDAADIVAELTDERAEQIFGEMEADEAEEIRELLAYPPDTAGGIMTPAFVAISPDLRADQAVTALRQVAQEAETIYYVYVLDAEEHLLGVLSLHNLVLSRPETPVRDLMVKSAIKAKVTDDQEAVARLITDYNLLAVPVVDEFDRLVGIVTQDDIADVLQDEATEDIERLGGSSPLEMSYRLASVPLLFRRRIVWLLTLFVAEAYTGSVLRHFEEISTEVIALTFFIPLIIGTGGNIGSQTVTTLVRAMAVGEVQLRDVRWVLAKEFGVAASMGLVMAIVAFGRAEILHVGSDVSLVIALTIMVICVWAATVAAVLPLILRKLRIDPAVVSAPLITTLVDGTGLVIYFTIAKAILNV
ncbi:MAG: magnesium transporter [Thermomicrobiales bacterium]